MNMKTRLQVLGVAIAGGAWVSLLGNPGPAHADPAAMAPFSLAEAKRELATTPGLTVLDVRTPEEFASGHLPGAVLLPVTEVDRDAATVLKDRDAPVLVYCRSGARSAAAVAKLKAQGYTRLWDLAGGIIAWQAAGEVVVK